MKAALFALVCTTSLWSGPKSPLSYIVRMHTEHKCTYCGTQAQFLVNIDGKKRFACKDHLNDWHKKVENTGKK